MDAKQEVELGGGAHKAVDPSGPLQREGDSLDDFEHLGHDSSPLSDKAPRAAAGPGGGAVDSGAGATPAPPLDLSSFDPLDGRKMDANLLEFGDAYDDAARKPDHPAAHEHDEPEVRHADLIGDFASTKSATQNFMDFERGHEEPVLKVSEQLERYSDSEEEEEEEEEEEAEKLEEIRRIPDLPDLPEPVVAKPEFRDFEFSEPELPKKDYPSAPPPEPVKVQAPVVAPTVPKPEPATATAAVRIQPDKKTVIDAEAIFCRMGLDTWFNPERLNPKVESLIYWRDPKKSGPVFGGVLLVLLALTYFSLISVVAYLSLLGLAGTISFRIYKNIVQAVQKTGDGHPFKELLEFDVNLPQEKVKEVTEIAVAHLNAAVVELRRLFLVEDLVDSIKFGVLLWTFTYLGAWFNGMTLIILAWIALFSLPKVYETNKTQIDANLEVVRTKLADITSKVKAAIPIGKKEEKKEQ